MALVRSDPFREIDRFFQQAFGGPGERSWGMPMDAFRKDDMFLLQLDVPGIAADAVELTVDNNVLTIKATRHAPTMQEGVEPVIAERPWGEFSRQVLLGNNLDAGKIRAEYDAGVLTVSIPVAEQAKPRRIEVSARSGAEAVPSREAQAVTGEPTLRPAASPRTSRPAQPDGRAYPVEALEEGRPAMARAHQPTRPSVPVPRLELRRLGDEVASALRAVTEARAATDAVAALTQVTVAIEQLTATQHELVNVLLDHGHSWSQVGEALCTSPAAVERRFPRRTRREASGPV